MRNKGECAVCDLPEKVRQDADRLFRQELSPAKVRETLKVTSPSQSTFARHRDDGHVFGVKGKNQAKREKEAALQEAVVQAIRELEAEMQTAPPVIKAGYLALIEQLRGSHTWKDKSNPETAAKLMKMITEATGMRTQQALLLAFADRMFNQVQSSPVRGELARSG